MKGTKARRHVGTKARRVLMLAVVQCGAMWCTGGCKIGGAELGGWDEKNEPCTEVEVSPITKKLKLRIAANASGDAEGEFTKKGNDFHAKFKGHFESDSAKVIEAQGLRAQSIPAIAEIQRGIWNDAEKNFGANMAMIMAGAGDAAPKLAGAYATFLSARAESMPRAEETGGGPGGGLSGINMAELRESIEARLMEKLYAEGVLPRPVVVPDVPAIP